VTIYWKISKDTDKKIAEKYLGIILKMIRIEKEKEGQK